MALVVQICSVVMWGAGKFGSLKNKSYLNVLEKFPSELWIEKGVTECSLFNCSVFTFV